MAERRTSPDPGTSRERMWLTDWLALPGIAQKELISTSRAVSMTVGTGFSILAAACDFVVEHAEQEVIFVTCFWARSDSLFKVSGMLLALSAKGLARNRKIKVRICVSSLSISQKLFHTWSPDGTIYDPAEWSSRFWIPSPDNLTGLDLQIKSVFIPPFSVIHSKFIVIDRKVCLLPSCNVSWENWFEGFVDLRGPIVASFVNYWESFWGWSNAAFSLSQTRYGDSRSPAQPQSSGAVFDNGMTTEEPGDDIPIFGIKSTPRATIQEEGLPFSFPLVSEGVETLFLPSPHHQNPQFRPFPCQKPPEPPRTPLNTFTLQAMEASHTSIYIQTPNVTSPPVLAALQRALARGVGVRIVTNEVLMRLEQLGTAGTTTPWCLSKLIRSYQKLKQDVDASRALDGGESLLPPGKLQIEYFAPTQPQQNSNSWAVSTHLKLTMIDADVVIVGSGNMDRASWYTSQELGVALLSEEVAERVGSHVTAALKDKLRCIYNSHVEEG